MAFKLVTDAELKLLMNITVDTWDTLLGQLSQQVAAQFQTYIGRKLEDSGTDVTEYRSPNGREYIVHVQRYPVVSVTSIHEDNLSDFTAATLVDSANYQIANDQGLIHRKHRPWYGGTRTVKIVYRGGYTASSGVLQGIPDEWAMAAKMQIAHVWQRREQIGATTIAFGGGASTTLPETGLLKGVKEILDPWRRIRF